MKRLLATAIAVIVTGGCDYEKQINNINTRLDTFNDRIKDISDVGAISELGWLSKLLRDSASGDEGQKAKARQAVASLFGIDQKDLQDDLLEVTVQFSDYAFGSSPSDHLDADLKFLDDPNPKNIEALFVNGNGWQPRPIGNPAVSQRTEQEIRRLIVSRLDSIFGPVQCNGQDPAVTGSPLTSENFHRTDENRDSLRGRECGFSITRTSDSVTGIPQISFNNWGDPNVAATSATDKRNRLISKWASVASATLDVAGMPPSGASDGQLKRSWGLTSIGLFAVVFVPEGEVSHFPKMQVRGWLHVKGHPDRILGSQIQIQATDFVERCSDNRPHNTNPPVDSKTSAGKLCWFAFDLFSAPTKVRLEQLRREAAQSAPKS